MTALIELAGCAFFWLLFFAQAKKSNSPARAKALLLLLSLLRLEA
ncbi:hypothetical protein [uncultured Xanthomonas sp.]|nr:hypothetical protein [uncultured Xanthomonas sp.]